MGGPAPGVPGWTPPGARRGRRRGRRGGGLGGGGPGRMLVWRVAAGVGAVVLAVVAGVVAGRPGGGERVAAASGVAVLVLARDLPAGAVPGGADLRTVLLPASAVPADAVPVRCAGAAPSGRRKRTKLDVFEAATRRPDRLVKPMQPARVYDSNAQILADAVRDRATSKERRVAAAEIGQIR